MGLAKKVAINKKKSPIFIKSLCYWEKLSTHQKVKLPEYWLDLVEIVDFYYFLDQSHFFLVILISHFVYLESNIETQARLFMFSLLLN